MEREDRSAEPDFLPPEPAGPEPELEPGERREEPAQQAWQQPQQGWQQPPAQPGWQQPPAWQGQAPPGGSGYGYAPPPPGWQPPPPGYGYGPPPGYGYYQPRPAEPENSAAIAGFVTSLVAGALLLVTGGLSGPISLIAAPFGMHYSRKGKRAVDEGKTPKHRSLAQAGFVIGIVTLVLSVLAIAAWVALVVVAATDEDFDRNFDNDGGFDSTRVRAGLAAARCAALLLG